MSALGIVTPFLIIMVILIAVYYLFAGSVPLNEVNSTVDKTSVFWGIVRGLMYGGLAFAVGFSTVVAIEATLLNVKFQVEVQRLAV